MAVKFEYTGKLSDGRIFDGTSTKKVIVEIDDNDLNVSELLEEFMNFLKAVGYSFDSYDYFDVVNDFKNWKDNSTGTSYPGYGAVPPNPIVDESGTIIGEAGPKVD